MGVQGGKDGGARRIALPAVRLVAEEALGDRRSTADRTRQSLAGCSGYRSGLRRQLAPALCLALSLPGTREKGDPLGPGR